MKIDSETLVPVGWVLSGFGLTLTAAVCGTFWISSVNDRLGRIEERLGIPVHTTSSLLFENACALPVYPQKSIQEKE
jgi:hypothetical protein